MFCMIHECQYLTFASETGKTWNCWWEMDENGRSCPDKILRAINRDLMLHGSCRSSDLAHHHVLWTDTILYWEPNLVWSWWWWRRWCSARSTVLAILEAMVQMKKIITLCFATKREEIVNFILPNKITHNTDKKLIPKHQTGDRTWW